MRFFTSVVIGLLMVGCAAKQEPPYQVSKVAEGFKFPEGPACDGRGNVYVSNCDADPGIVSKVDEVGNSSVAFTGSARTFLKTNGITAHQSGSIFACDFGKKAIVELRPDGSASTYADNYQGVPFRGPNDLAFDPNGNLYFTDPAGSSKQAPVGRVYRVDKLKNVTLVAQGLAFPNGIAFSADGKTLFVAESQKYQVLKYPVKMDGSLGEKSVFCTLPEEKDPDGMNFDSAGNLWVAQFGAGAVREFDPSGKLIRSIEMPGKKVTNVEFGGKDMKTLYITEVETGGLYRIRTEVPGLKLFYGPG
jgi:gluconolactonase